MVLFICGMFVGAVVAFGIFAMIVVSSEDGWGKNRKRKPRDRKEEL